MTTLMKDVNINCSFCKTQITCKVIDQHIALIVSPDCLIICSKSECTALKKDLEFYNEKLSRQRYIETITCTPQERITYEQKLLPLKNAATQFNQTYKNVFRYLNEMDQLLRWQYDVECDTCACKYKYLKFENLIYGFKEDAHICNDCYYKYMEKLVYIGN
jgi:hypothetical protein